MLRDKSKYSSAFYKSEPFYFMHRGFRIHNQIQFPEEASLDKQFEFTTGDDNPSPKVTFQIEVETYLPSVQESTEFFKGKSIETFNINWIGLNP